jgi:retron-type reverse transcriptase
MNKLEPVFTSLFISNTYSCIKGRGIHGAANAVKIALKDVTNTKYCLKLDIKQFYPSIDHDILKEILRRKIKDKDLLWLLDEIIDSSDGIPIGNYLSQYFANLYLTYFDHWLKEVKKVTYYFRYADDIVVLHSSKEYLHELLAEMREYLKVKLKLTIKSNYQVFVVSIRGIDFVGYVFFHTHTLLRKTIKKRFARMMYRQRNRQSFSAYNGWIIHCNGKHLIKKILYGQQRFRLN